MSRYEERLEVAAPPAAVWAVMQDVVRWPEWTPTVTAVEPVSGPDLAVGADYRVRQPRLPAVVWTVTELHPGRSFAWTSQGPGVRSRGDHRVEPTADGCTAVLAFEQSGPLAGLSSAIWSRLIRRYVHTETEQLKRTAEDRVRAQG